MFLLLNDGNKKYKVDLGKPTVSTLGDGVKIVLGEHHELILTAGENVDLILALREAEDELTKKAFEGNYLDLE